MANEITFFNHLVKEHEVLIEVWKEGIKYELDNGEMINHISSVYSCILFEAIHCVEVYNRKYGTLISTDYDYDKVFNRVKTMNMKEVLTPITFDYIIEQFFTRNPIS